ncbi:MAG: DNA-directed DNA polymerase [Candidatus Aenigmatarchaeota archaeon]
MEKHNNIEKIKVFILDADSYEDNEKSIVRIYCKDENGNKIVFLDESYIPYFYILPEKGKEELIKKRVLALKKLGVINCEIEEKNFNLEKRKFIKVFCKKHSDIIKIRSIVKMWERSRGGSGVIDEYEYTIPLHKKYLLDKNLSSFKFAEVEYYKILNKDYRVDFVGIVKSIKPIDCFDIPKIDMLAFDIENVEENGKQKIIALSLYSPNFKKVLIYKKDNYPKNLCVEVVKDEKELLEKFVDYLKKINPDILLGFMTDEHDFKIIQKRASELKVNLDIAKDKNKLKFIRRKRVSSAKIFGLVHVDIFSHILNILAPKLQTEVLNLESISSEILGDSKIEMEFEEIVSSWRKEKNLSKLAEYCLKDSELVYRLSEFLLPQIFELCRLTNQLLFDVSRMTYGQLAEAYLMKYVNEKNTIILNQPKFDEILERQKRPVYVGGYVKEPISGIHENLAVLDFRSLYPSIIATFNISPETLNHCSEKESFIVPELNYKFCKNHKGFISSAIENLIFKRIEIKKKLLNTKSEIEKNILDNMQQAIKTVTNAMYGMMAFSGARWYCADCAASAAAYGRYYIKEMIKIAEKNGFTVLYADTDSMFIETKGNIKKETNKLIKLCNSTLPGLLKIELQEFYKRGIFMPRETGIGVAKKRYALLDEKGNLVIRGLERVRADWCRLARNTQERVIEAILKKKSLDLAINEIKKAIESLKNKKVNIKDLAIFEQLSKPLSEYKVKSPHISAARKIIERGRQVGEGSVIIYVITKKGESIADKAEPIEDVTINDIDIDYYIKKQIIPPSLRVLIALGISEEKLYKILGV